MTKANEILLLDETIAKFGDASYLGPWLRAYRHVLVADITSDVTPSAPMPAEAHRDGLAILASARKDAEAIRSAAEADAKANLQRVQQTIAAIKQSAASELTQHVKRLEGRVW